MTIASRSAIQCVSLISQQINMIILEERIQGAITGLLVGDAFLVEVDHQVAQIVDVAPREARRRRCEMRGFVYDRIEGDLGDGISLRGTQKSGFCLLEPGEFGPEM